MRYLFQSRAVLTDPRHGRSVNETPIDWLESIPILLAAHRAGSARGAALALGIGTATVTRHLDRLEASLGTPLFIRTPSGLRPTEALSRVEPWATRIEAAATGLVREIAGLETEAVGTVRLAILPSLANWFVVPALPDLLARHPGLDIHLLPASAVLDLAHREADLALRAIRPTRGPLVVKRLALVPSAVVASPALLERVAPTTYADLPWVTFDESVIPGLPDDRFLAAAAPGARRTMRSTDFESLIRAAQAGVGAMVLGLPMAERVGGLVRVRLPGPAPVSMALFLVGHEAVRPIPRVAAVWDWLIEQFEAVDVEAARILDYP